MRLIKSFQHVATTCLFNILKPNSIMLYSVKLSAIFFCYFQNNGNKFVSYIHEMEKGYKNPITMYGVTHHLESLDVTLHHETTLDINIHHLTLLDTVHYQQTS